MRIVAVPFLILLLFSFSVQAQQKIYRTLGAKFKYLRQDQITITPLHEMTKASFVYQQRQYKAFFDRDTSLIELLIIQGKSDCPTAILSDMNCLYRKYELAQWQIREYYASGLMTDTQTEVIVHSTGSNYDQWEYKNGVRANNPIWVDRQEDGEYQVMELLMASGRREEGTLWYGGSFEAFSDSVEKYVQLKDPECFKKFANKNLPVYISVNPQGVIMYSGFSVAVPYLLEESFQQYCKQITFPPTGKEDPYLTYRFHFNIYLSTEKGLQVEP